MRRRRWTTLALVLAGLACARAGAAQQRPAADADSAPRALVLGGGGARGLAHAGVLVGMERLGHDPDLVVGTSIGAIIGGLYAAGYSPETIWRLLEEQDWQRLFTADPIRVGPEREERHPVIGFGFGAERWVWARGTISDRGINRLLVRSLFDAGARARGDFDRLPRRFRAIAADLETGDAVVLGAGDLARAVRASMSVPGIFAPVAWDGRLLVDGGIADYLPVSVARRLGARHVIAVDVIRPPAELKADELDPIDVGARGLRLMLLNTLPDTLAPDVLLLPEIDPGVSEAMFPRDAAPRMRTGLEEALERLPIGPAEPGGVVREPHPPPDTLAALRLEVPDPSLEPIVRHVFGRVAPGRYHADAVLSAVDRLYATGLFQGVWPRVVPADDAQAVDDAPPAHGSPPVLVVRAEPLRPTFVTGAPGWDNDRGFRGWAVLRHRVRAGTPTEFALAASAGALERWGSASVRVHPARLAPLAGTAGGYVRETDVRRFGDGERAGERTVLRAGSWIGLEWRRVRPQRTAVALLRAEHVDSEGGATGLSAGPLVRFGAPADLLRVVGVPPRIEAELRAGDVGYGRLHARGSLDGAVGRLRLGLLGDVAVVGEGAPADVRPALGDAHLVPGFRWDERPGRARAVGGLDVAYPIPLDGWLRLRLRAGAVGADADVLDEGGAWVLGAALEGIWWTPAGPVRVGFGANTDGAERFELSLGPVF